MQRFSGTWWLPHEPNVARNGFLTVDERNAGTLLLDGAFGGAREIAVRRITEPVIHGTLDDGRPVSLLHAYHDIVNVLGQEYFVRHTVLGTHITGATPFRSVRSSGSQLDNFLAAPAGVKVDSREPGARVVTTFRGFRLVFSVDRTDEEALVDQQPRSHMTFHDIPDWATAWELMSALSLFLTLATGEENALMTVEIEAEEGSASVFSSTRTVAHERAADRDRRWLVLALADIAALDLVLAKFDDFQIAMRHALEPFIAYIREPGDIQPAANRIAQTLESYHRDRVKPDGTPRYRKTQIDPQAFDDIRAAFAALLKEKFPAHTAIVGQLRNDRSLRERLRELYTEHAALLDEICDMKTLLDAATRNRNVFSHGGNATITSDIAEAMLWSGERLRFLFYAIVLAELGYEKSAAHELLRRNAHFDMLRLRKDT